MSKKAERTNAERYLDKRGCEYERITYPHGSEAVDGVTVAALTGIPPENVFKTLVITDGKGEYFIGCIPVNTHLSLKKMEGAHRNKTP